MLEALDRATEEYGARTTAVDEYRFVGETELTWVPRNTVDDMIVTLLYDLVDVTLL